MVKELLLFRGGRIMSNKNAKKLVEIVSIKMVREGSILYDIRKISSPADAVS